MSSSQPPVAPSLVRSPPVRSPRAAAAAAGNAGAAAGTNNNKPSFSSRVRSFCAREGPAGIIYGIWACLTAAAVAVAATTWNDERVQRRRAETEREFLTSSSEDWRQAKREAKEAAKDARSAASKWRRAQ